MHEACEMCWSEAGGATHSSGAQESEQGTGVLQAALDLMHTLLRQVSDVVRRALQARTFASSCPFFTCFFVRVECRCVSLMLHVECMVWGVEGGGSILGICSDLPAIQSSGAV